MRRWIAAAAVAWAAAAPLPAETFWIATFGDSITDGSCCPESPPYSYRVRLGSLLAGWCPPDSCTLVNHGAPTETTAGGLTRLQNSVIPSNSSWDLFLTMEATNDIFNNISLGTMQFNLEKMDEALADAGIDNIITSVIEFHPWVMNVSRPPTCPGTTRFWVDNATRDLRNALQPVAATRNRYFADAWDELCPRTGTDRDGHVKNDCFGLLPNAGSGNEPPTNASGNNHFGEGCKVGHPNRSGFDMLADRFFETMTQVPKPGAVSAPSPANGASLCGAPTFSWTKEAAERATFYEIDIDSGGFRRWRQEVDWRAGQPDLCQPDSDPNNVCSWPDPAALAEGAHTWRVRGRNPGGFGTWSATQSFNLALNTPPTATSLTQPVGEVYAAMPTFEWGEVAGATGYRLLVKNSGGSTVIDQTYTSSVCTASVCQATPAGTLTAGAHSWQIETRNGACLGALSAEAAFTLYTGVPAATQPLSPNDSTFKSTPPYRWQKVAAVTFYDLEVFDGAAWNPAGSYDPTSCGFSTCSAAPVSPVLTPGARSFRVTTRNPHGSGPVSSEQPFMVLDCAAFPDLILENDTVTTAQTHRACNLISAGNLGAGDYLIQGAGADVLFHAGASIALHDGFRVEADAKVSATLDD